MKKISKSKQKTSKKQQTQLLPTDQDVLQSRKRQHSTNEELSEDDSYDQQNELVKAKIGKVPYGWYDQFKHIGYDNKLQPVQKQKHLDKIQEFIKKSENKDWWRTIRDQLNGVDIKLTDEQLQLIDRIRSGKMASKTIANSQYQIRYDYQDPFPIHAHPPSKKNFMPSKWEQMKVNKILDGLLSGRIKWNKQPAQAEEDQKVYDAWSSGTLPQRGVINIAPMKQRLPDHNQSYNPPKQYLLSPQQKQQLQQMDEEDRPYNFIPACYQKMRHIPFYDKLIQQRFQRCLDLYLCPRVKKKKLNVDPDSLVPKLPDPSGLKPFPTALNIIYDGHESAVIAIAVSPNGEYFATGDQQGTIIIWDTLTSRKLYRKTYEKQSINSISWSIKNMILFSHNQKVEIMIWKYPKELKQVGESAIIKDQNQTFWQFYEENTPQYRDGFRIYMQFQNDITHLQFHPKGDYFLTICPHHSKKNEVIMIHQLSTCETQKPFEKAKGVINKAYFHSRKPILILLTGSKVFLYNLQKLQMQKKLKSVSDSLNCVSMHPYGDHLVVGCSDQKVIWYDLDLGDTPYKTLQYHQKGITSADFHKQYPLMATASNDGTVQIFHAKISTENILQDALILPLKVLRGHQTKGINGVSGVKFHPKQPWIFSIGYDNKVYLWT